jgi:GNAT superfamily N-acetyltransferase
LKGAGDLRAKIGGTVEIHDEPLSHLAEHARLSIAFEVDRILDVTVQQGGLGGLPLFERRLAAPYVKDYDAIPGNGPAEWERRFDLSNWGLLSARREGRAVGGAVIAFNTKGLDMLEGRSDLAVLWDLRVSPEMRRRSVGSALFAAAAQWATAKGCHWLKVETQNINVAACKFYASRGCELGAIHRFAYPDLPEEVQLLWYKDLSRVGMA